MEIFSLASYKKYFKSELHNLFSDNEIKFMFNQLCEERLAVRDAYYIFTDFDLKEEDKIYFLDVIQRLKKNEPFQQIIGFQYFCDLKIKVTKDVLIPRPETEELVDLIFNQNRGFQNDKLQIIDFCSGSGCIALSLKDKFSNSIVRGLEKSKSAIEVSVENSQNLNLNVDFKYCDILSDNCEIKEATIDIIVSNPPYVLEKEKGEMSPNVLNFEPSLALFVHDNDPLIFYRKIAEDGKKILKDEGRIYFEINEKYGKDILQLLQELGYNNTIIHKDLQGRERMISAIN